MGLTWRGLAAFANTIRRKYGRSLNAIPVCGSGFREDAARRHNSNALCTRPVHGPQFAVGPGTQIGAYLSIHFWRVSLQFGPALKQCTRARAHTPNLWVHARAERATAPCAVFCLDAAAAAASFPFALVSAIPDARSVNSWPVISYSVGRVSAPACA